jgi:RNA polymerase sigma-70 factor (ECF subfamily)
MLNFRDDATAFRAFISEHQNRVFNAVLNMVQHQQDAEDITQDVFVDVYRKPGSFRGEAAVSTWLYRIAMNKCIDHLRRRQRRRWEAGEKEATDFVHPGIVAENREKAIFLYKAMKQLPPKQNEAWVLSEMENLSYKEISEVMKLSVASVESLLFRARQNLRKILSELSPNKFL